MSNSTPKLTYTIDTVGLVLHLEKRWLSANVLDILQQAEAQRAMIMPFKTPLL